MINPLHLPVPTDHQSNYNSLSSALPTHSFRLLPQGTYKAGCKYMETIQKNDELRPDIIFDYAGGRTHQGVLMRELAGEHPPALADNDTLPNFDAPHITLIIMWEGYQEPKYTYIIPIGPNTTLARLGNLVAKNFLKFCNEIQRNGKRNQNPQWCIVEGGICFEQLRLVKLLEMSPGKWQAEVLVQG